MGQTKQRSHLTLRGSVEELGTGLRPSGTVSSQLLVLSFQPRNEVFDNTVCGRDAAQRLLHLRLHVADYAVEFHTLEAKPGWNDTSLKGAFLHRLSEGEKDELDVRDWSDSLDGLVAVAIK